jgi:hypothetical protein
VTAWARWRLYHFGRWLARVAQPGPTCAHCERSVDDATGSNGGRCHALSVYRKRKRQ